MPLSGLLALGMIVAVVLLLARAAMAKRSFLPMGEIMELQKKGAILLDVRSMREFEQEHAPGSLNIPLKQIRERLGELDREKPILVCCASGARSSLAAQILQRAGFPQVHNVGSWTSLR